MASLSREPNAKFNLRHKLFMFAMSLERAENGYGPNNPMPESVVSEIQAEVKTATETLWPMYESRSDAALWLHRELMRAGTWDFMGDRPLILTALQGVSYGR
jgi:hypothetical protein